MNGELKTRYLSLLNDIKIRNQYIVEEVKKAEKSYHEIAKQFGLSPQRIKQILKSKGVSVPLVKDSLKWLNWKKHISDSKKGKLRKKDGEQSQPTNPTEL